MSVRLRDLLCWDFPQSEDQFRGEGMAGIARLLFVAGRDVFLFESRGTVARHFAKFKESCAVEYLGAAVRFRETN
jgi:hypothetical protein